MEKIFIEIKTIEEQNFIKLLIYIYESADDVSETPYRYVEYEPELIALDKIKTLDEFLDYCNENLKTYITDITWEEALNTRAKNLLWEDLNESTSEGLYQIDIII